jgi:hypothetical protein
VGRPSLSPALPFLAAPVGASRGRFIVVRCPPSKPATPTESRWAFGPGGPPPAPSRGRRVVTDV